SDFDLPRIAPLLLGRLFERPTEPALEILASSAPVSRSRCRGTPVRPAATSARAHRHCLLTRSGPSSTQRLTTVRWRRPACSSELLTPNFYLKTSQYPPPPPHHNAPQITAPTPAMGSQPSTKYG